VRLGRRFAIDFGSVRIGTAASDFHGILASPIETVSRTSDIEVCVREILALISDVAPLEVYVGLPISMGGNKTQSTQEAIDFAKTLAGSTDISVRMIDERLTTVSSATALKASGKSSKEGRKIVDQIAATVILEQALQSERNSGVAPGIAIEDIDEHIR
jgi:putative Holliday junction resolvase